jgi:hypothetical protein
MDGAKIVPSPSNTKATGSAFVTIVNATFASASFYVSDMAGMFMAHIHNGSKAINGPPVVWGFNSTLNGNWQVSSCMAVVRRRTNFMHALQYTCRVTACTQLQVQCAVLVLFCTPHPLLMFRPSASPRRT